MKDLYRVEDSPLFSKLAPVGRLARRVRDLVSRRERNTAWSVESRLAEILLNRQLEAGAGPFTLCVSQAALAEEIGTVREVVVRALASFCRQRLLKRERRGWYRVWTPTVGPASDVTFVPAARPPGRHLSAHHSPGVPMRLPFLCFALLLPAARAQAQDSIDHAHMDHAAHASHDSAFAAVQQRGGVYMGVDQTKSAHRFDAQADGGRIELQSTAGDSADVAAIRRHFQTIAHQFAKGDFETPFAVHAEKVPETEVMRERRDRISYQLIELPRGAALRLITKDAQARRAIQEFMAYQRREHHAGGQE